MSDVLHVLLHMADQKEPVTSGFLAQMMRTHPVVVRRMLGGLREIGLVGSTRGRMGGWTLTCTLSEITLLDIYKGVGAPALFAMGSRNESSQCLVEKAVNGALADSFVEAETFLLERFGQTTLQTLHESFSRDMAAVKASLCGNEQIA
ncbi:MAG: Rrf2 family transcriptional regulator [Pseudomonadota bacterium]